MKIILISLSLTWMMLFAMSGCENTINNNENIVFPDSNVSYSKHVEPFMRVTCAYYGCHSRETQAGGVDLGSWDGLKYSRSGAMVIDFHPENSILVQMIEGRMYHEYSYLWKINDNQKKGITRWIVEGAKNN